MMNFYSKNKLENRDDQFLTITIIKILILYLGFDCLINCFQNIQNLKFVIKIETIIYLGNGSICKDRFQCLESI